jgi:pyruvate kinase
MKEDDKFPGLAEQQELLREMIELREQLLGGAALRLAAACRADDHASCSASAHNLAHYLALRCRDLRTLQSRLARQGLSSLGRVESHVLASIDQVIRVLSRLCGVSEPTLDRRPAPGFEAGNELLASNTRKFFGRSLSHRGTRIMVTIPSEAALDETLIRSLMDSGMDCARINCAHDDAQAWLKMIGYIRRHEVRSGRRCRVAMDLAGHKLRTGPLEDAVFPTRLKVRRDASGRARAPARIAVLPPGFTGSIDTSTADAWLSLPHGEQPCLVAGDRLEFTDLRGRRRRLEIQCVLDQGGWLAHCRKSARIGEQTILRHLRLQGDNWAPVSEQDISLVGHPRRAERIRLFPGDPLCLTAPAIPGRPAITDADGRVIEPARIGIIPAQVLHRLESGQIVWIDDGKAGAVVETVLPDSVLLRMTNTRAGGFRLKPDKGVNLPGADLGLPALSPKDLEDLDFVVGHADMVGFSFVETVGDMFALMEQLECRGAGGMPIIAKIETGRAVRNLPEILLATIGRQPLSVMIARGDLAVEIGGERLAEIQEEILWLAEAAHVPVVWATQVLETTARTGVVSRPELSDAAMSARAECVMLNKGPFIVDALRTLDAILCRMQEHQRKKTAQLRALHLAEPSVLSRTEYLTQEQ